MVIECGICLGIPAASKYKVDFSHVQAHPKPWPSEFLWKMYDMSMHDSVIGHQLNLHP